MPEASIADPARRRLLLVKDYDLAATLACGQAFRWSCSNGAWTSVIGRNWVRLRACGNFIEAETAAPVSDWEWLEQYLQTGAPFESMVATFPKDAPMESAVAACRGLRLLRQEPWECLASFILSSTKQIVQIRQIVSLLCERFGEAVAAPAGEKPVFAFPTPHRTAAASEQELRACLMGFRAPYLKATATAVASGTLSLEKIGALPLLEARAALEEMPGVGRKVADCVLLFAYDFPTAFPIDVWVLKALRELYFHRRRVTMKRLRHFSESHFGPHGGYAQQYLFHYMRNVERKNAGTRE